MAGSGVSHLDGAEHAVPRRLDLVERLAGPAPGSRVGRDECRDVVRRVRLAEDEDDLLRPGRGPGRFGVMSAAHGSSAGADAAGQADRGRGRPGAAVEPLRPRNSVRSAVNDLRPRPDVGEGDRPAKLPGPGVAGQHGAGLRVELADDLQRRVVADGAQHPLGVERRRQPPGPVAGVAHRQADQLDRVVGRDEHQQVLLQSVTRRVKRRVALAVADGDGRAGAARQGRRRPDLAGLLVAQIDDLAGRVGDRVVAPGRQAVHLAVAGPGVARPGLGHQEAEAGVGEHVDPRGRRQASATGRR